MKRTNTAVWLEKYNRWQIKVQKDNIRKTFTCSTSGRNGQRECNKKADEWLDDNISDSKLKVIELSNKYLEQLKITTSKSHWSQYEGYFNNWINPNIGTVRIENLTENHLQIPINKAYSKGLAKKTLCNIRACELNFLKYCRKSKTTTLFVESLLIPKSARVCERTILNPSDLQKLFTIDTSTCHNKIEYELFVQAFRFGVVTGLRPGELIGLKWSDIRESTLYIQRSINVNNEITRGKNDNARRTLYLTSIAINILSDQKAKLKEIRIESDYIFCDKYGDFIQERNYYKRWQKYCLNNSITKTSPYEL